MDFLAVTFFTWSLYKVFQLECLILLVIKIIIISNQISVWSCLSKFFIKNRVTFFLSLLKKKEELCHMKLFLCSSIWYFTEAILSKNSYQKLGVQKKDKKEGWSYSRVVGWGCGWPQKGDQTFCTLCTKMLQYKTHGLIRLNNSRPNWAKIVLLLEKKIF